MLRKIFIGINTNFPVDFKCDQVDKKLFVRATPIFSLSQHNQDLVLRCMPHAQPTDASNAGQNKVKVFQIPKFINTNNHLQSFQ